LYGLDRSLQPETSLQLSALLTQLPSPHLFGLVIVHPTSVRLDSYKRRVLLVSVPFPGKTGLESLAFGLGTGLRKLTFLPLA
jgi:hypothetical protein